MIEGGCLPPLFMVSISLGNKIVATKAHKTFTAGQNFSWLWWNLVLSAKNHLIQIYALYSIQGISD